MKSLPSTVIWQNSSNVDFYDSIMSDNGLLRNICNIEIWKLCKTINLSLLPTSINLDKNNISSDPVSNIAQSHEKLCIFHLGTFVSPPDTNENDFLLSMKLLLHSWDIKLQKLFQLFYSHDGDDDGDLNGVFYVLRPVLYASVWNATGDAVTNVGGGVHGYPNWFGDD